MATSKVITAAEVGAALAPVRGWLDGEPAEHSPSAASGDSSRPGAPDRHTLATAVRTTLRAFAQAHPGKAVEVRVPPFAAVQCLAGGAHTRGTPPHVIETDPATWLRLATGRLAWSAAVAGALVYASGHRTEEVGALLPMPAAIKCRHCP
jgi:hypothetical protein